MKTPVSFVCETELLKKMDQYVYLRRIKSRSTYIIDLIEQDLKRFPDDVSSLGDFDREILPLIK